MRQIALEAGVSGVTVSNVLRGVENRASVETRERVLQAAQKLNYIPVKPPTTQNYRMETQVVTFVPEQDGARYYELDLFTYQGVMEGAFEHDYSVMTMVHRRRDRQSEREWLRYLDRSSDGFIFTASSQAPWTQILDLVAQNQVPTVVCYKRDVPPGVAWVDVDNGGAMRQAIEHLVARGHTRIGFVAGPSDNFNATEREREWHAAINEYELDGDLVVQGGSNENAHNNGALTALTELGVTAAVCFNDMLAVALWDAIEARGGSVPHDMSIIGMDNRLMAQTRGLSSISHSFVDVGRLAMEAWVELKNGADAATCSRLAPAQLVVRDSVRSLNLWEPDFNGDSVATPNPSERLRLHPTSTLEKS